MVRRAVRNSTILPFSLLAAAAGGLLAGCGQQRQDVKEKSANYTLDVVSASFPPSQHVSGSGRLVLVVRNAGRRAVPNVAVTITNFSEQDAQPGLSNTERPVWIVNDGPGPSPSRAVENTGPDVQGGDTTVYTNTWAAGPLPAGRTATLVWKVTPVRSGTHTITYRVDAGLNRKARARTSSHQPPQGSLTADISRTPALAHVDPNSGRVLSGPYPLAPNG
jgi:hypothetical protein